MCMTNLHLQLLLLFGVQRVDNYKTGLLGLLRIESCFSKLAWLHLLRENSAADQLIHSYTDVLVSNAKAYPYL